MKTDSPIFLLLILAGALCGAVETQAAAYTLTVTADHGSVRVSPDKPQYDAGEIVELIPRPEVGYCFASWSGDAHSKQPVLNLTMDSDKSIIADFGTWQPPIGIPTPPFGINETYRMYDDLNNRGPNLTYTQNAEGGYYTHYVDNTDPNATDTSNPYGTVAKPRKTVPTTIPQGAVVEVHGGPYTTRYCFWTFQGTAAQPAFVRGVLGSEPEFRGSEIYVWGSYAILENIDVSDGNLCTMVHSLLSYPELTYGCVRNCIIRDHVGNTQAGITAGSNNLSHPNEVHDVLFYNNLIHELGDFEAIEEGQDNDFTGIVISSRTRNIWVIDNRVYRTTGSGIVVNAQTKADSHHIYIGRNIISDLYQSGIGLKECSDVIISQNTCFNILSRYEGEQIGSPGKGFSFQYGPDEVWFLFNTTFHCPYGIFSATAEAVTGGEIYIIGNLIYDLYCPEHGLRVGISLSDDEDATKYIINNTIHSGIKGIDIARGTGGIHVRNNIISSIRDMHVENPEAAKAGNSSIGYTLFDVTARIQWGSQTVRNVRQMQADFGECTSCIETDPLFVNVDGRYFSLQPTSFAIDAGTSSGVVQEAFDRFQQLYGIDIRKDKEGTVRTGTWDIGAYEYVLSSVADLSVSGVSRNSVTCRWTVPGEEGITGQPASYDIRYAQIPITEANWEAATQVQGEPVPGGFGEQQSFTITGLNPGAAYYIAMKVGDAAGHFSVLSNVVSATTATSGNHAPVLTPIGDRSVAETGTLTFLVSATDADGDPLTYSATGLPTGANFTPGTQSFAWTPTNLQSGRYRVMFQVTDTHVTVSETITITVREGSNEAPVLGAIGDKSVNENAPLSFSVSATDQDGDSLTFSAAGLPSGATFVGGAFTWTPNYSQAGSYQVTFTVSDGELTDSEQITITVANVTDQTAPVADEVFPPPDAVQVPVNPVITFALTDLGLGIDPNTVAIRVSDQLVYTGNNILYNSPDGICRRTGNPMDYHYYFFPNDPFDFDQPVSVLVNASDLAHNAMTPLSYQFVTEMRSFGQNQLVSSNTGSSGHPAIATDSDGNLWAAWHTGQAGSGDIYVAKRGSDAQQWGDPFRLTNLDSDQHNPAMAIGSNDTLYVTWQDNRRGNWDIYVAVSLDGVTWNDAVRLTDPNTNETNPAIAIDRASPNHVYIAWQQDEGAGNQDIYVASSSTRFISKAVTQVTSQAASQTEPALAVGSDNTAYLVWTDRRNGSADIYGSSSSAVSWANVAIATGAGNQSNPAIAVEPESSSLHVLWVSDTTGNLDVVGGVANGLPGAPISGSVIVDDTTGADQSAPTVLAVKDHWNRSHIYACWQDNRSVADSGDSDLYFAEIRSGAAGTNILVGDDGANSNQSDPALGFDRYGEPVVLWVDDRGSTAQIYGACSTYSDPVSLASGTIPSSTGGRVGPDPASIGHDSDVSIGIASNALGCDALLAISKLQNAQAFGAPCLASYEISPSGIQFSPPATVVIPYMASGSGPATPYWYDAQTGMLSQLGITGITRTTLPNGLSVVSFNTTHLTSFYVLEGSSAVGGGGGGGGGGGCALSRVCEGNVVGYFLPYGALALFLFVRRWMDGRRKGDSERASAS